MKVVVDEVEEESRSVGVLKWSGAKDEENKNPQEENIQSSEGMAEAGDARLLPSLTFPPCVLSQRKRA